MAMGIWPFFIAAGLLLRDLLKNRWSLWIFFVLPLFYGTEHLSILEHAYPSPIGHRIIMNGFILVLVLFDMYDHRRSNKKARDEI